MQVASVMVAVAGDEGNTVPKMSVTPTEVAVLRSIHGESSVTNIKILGTINRSNRDERARIFAVYGRATDGNQNSIVAMLFPGAAARMFEDFKELELDPEFYHVDSKEAGVEERPETVVGNETITPIEALPEEQVRTIEKIEAEAANDGIDDMDDAAGKTDDGKLFE